MGARSWCSDKILQGQWSEVTRALECAWKGAPLKQLIIGEDYFESIMLLRAVTEAKRRFVSVELGSGWGYWAVKGAVAWQKNSTNLLCDIVLIEANTASLGKAPLHLAENNVLSFCNVTMLLANATGELLDELIFRFGTVDMLHVDIQGQELEVLRSSQYLQRIKNIFIGTHCRIVHRQLRGLLQAAKFKLEFDYGGSSFPKTRFGRLPINDGILAATQQEVFE